MGTSLHNPGCNISGAATDWRATIHLNNKLVDISAESTLRGLASDLPEPFSKAAADAAPLRLERKAVSPDRDRLVVTYGNADNRNN